MHASQETGKVAWYFHLLRNFTGCCDPHSQDFSVVNEAKADVFLGLPCFLHQESLWLDVIIESMDMNLRELWEKERTGTPGMLQSMGSQRVRHDWATKDQQIAFPWSNDVGILISGSSAFSKASLYIWKLWVHVLLKSSLKDEFAWLLRPKSLKVFLDSFLSHPYLLIRPAGSTLKFYLKSEQYSLSSLLLPWPQSLSALAYI